MRDEYKFILARIWEIIGEDGGIESGYVPKPDIDATPAKPGPPYNPFEGLHIECSEEDEPPGVMITGTPGIGERYFSHCFCTFNSSHVREEFVFIVPARAAPSRPAAHCFSVQAKRICRL